LLSSYPDTRTSSFDDGAVPSGGILDDADDTLLGLVILVIHPQLATLIRSPFYRALVTTFLARDGKQSNTPPPVPCSLRFLACVLVSLCMYPYAASLVAEGVGVHPALRTLDGCLSLLWWYISRENENPEGIPEDEWLGWSQVRSMTLARLEADEEV